ncbi:MAG: hypothetical protein H7138_19455, partial [Myxococcales bacterium]|nr:hypothetical protein [Myxococcales bacterium]
MYLSPFAGYAVRVSYWLMEVIATGAQLVAASIYMGFWFPSVPGGRVRGRRRSSRARRRDRSRQDRREVERDPFALGAAELQLEVAGEVVVVAQLEAMRARIERDAAAQRVERRDIAAVDIELRVAHVALQVDDRVARGDAAGAGPCRARAEHAEQPDGE